MGRSPRSSPMRASSYRGVARAHSPRPCSRSYATRHSRQSWGGGGASGSRSATTGIGSGPRCARRCKAPPPDERPEAVTTAQAIPITDPTDGPEGMGVRKRVTLGIVLALVAEAGLLGISGWQSRHVLNNPDGVAYIRNAVYLVQGEYRLAASGHWGPLISGMAAVPLLLGLEPIPAMRIALGLSGLIFTLGCVAVLRSVQTPAIGMVIGAWLAALAGVVWSSWQITPDLLLAGLFALASSRLLSGAWLRGR